MPSPSEFATYYAEAGRQLANALGGRFVRLPGIAIADAGVSIDDFNQATMLEPPSADDVKSIGEALDAQFGPAPGRGFRLFSTWAMPGAMSLQLEGPFDSPCMARSPGGRAPGVPPELRVVTVEDREDLTAWEAGVRAIFGWPAMDPLSPAIFTERILGSPAIRLCVGYLGDRPVSCSGAYLVHDVVLLDHMGTVPDARGRGYDEALIWKATSMWPDRAAVLEAGHRRRPIYESVGYEVFAPAWSWTRPTA